MPETAVKKILNQKINAALAWENKIKDDERAYVEYVAAIIELGDYCQTTVFEQNSLIRTKAEQKKEDKRQRKFIPKPLESEEKAKLRQIFNQSNQSNLAQIKLAAYSPGRLYIKQAWEGFEEEKKRIASNTHYNKSTRDQFDIGMAVLDEFFPAARIIKDTSEYDQFHTLKACEAIQQYKTRRQKILSYVSKALSGLAALAYGLVTAVAILAVLKITWPVIVFASLMFCASVLVNYIMFKGATYSFLNAVMGKDKPFEGFREYVNKHGKISRLSFKKILAVPGLLIVAASVGLAQAGFTAGAFLLVAHIAGFALLAAGLGACWPVGVALIAATIFCFTALMFKEAFNMLQEESVQKALLRPFREFKETINKIYDPRHENNINISPRTLNIQKGITYGLLIFLCVISVGGLIGLSYVCTASMTSVLTHFTHLSLKAAVGISYLVSMGVSIIPEGIFQLASVAASLKKVIEICWKKTAENIKNISENKIQNKFQHKSLVITGVIILGANFFNAAGNGWLVGGTIHGLITGTAAAIVSAVVLGTAEFFNNFFPVIAEEEDTDDENAEEVEKTYTKITQNLKQSKPNNPPEIIYAAQENADQNISALRPAVPAAEPATPLFMPVYTRMLL